MAKHQISRVVATGDSALSPTDIKAMPTVKQNQSMPQFKQPGNQAARPRGIPQRRLALAGRRRRRIAAQRATAREPLGGGGRFKATQASVAAGLKPGAIRPGQTRTQAAAGIAAAAGRRKLGKKRFQALSAGKKRR